MPLITLNQASIAFGAEPILDQASIRIEAGDRIALIGRNGAGKSTLLKVLDGSIALDDGDCQRQPNIRCGRLIQEVPNDLQNQVRSVVALGDPEQGQRLIAQYQNQASQENDNADIWDLDRRVKTLCSKFDIDPNIEFSTLSGGMRRRVLMAQALVTEPDLLLLDEPTNHLDIDTILWLENLVHGLSCAMVIVSHDRAFIDKVCSKIWELDRGIMREYPGSYQSYLQTKAKELEDEETLNAKFDKKLAQEEVWIRQGIQARRTRNEGRVRALKKMRQERKQRRERQGSASIILNEGGKSGKLVAEAKLVSLELGGKKIIDDFSCRIQRGDKVGILGPNGSGKSTLIKLLTGELDADSGTIRLGTNLQIAYLDQHRSAIRDDLSVQDNVSGNTEIEINGQRKHILGYLQDFLFSPSRARAPAAKLSGGERNRLLLAKLFTKPFNLLILDEPTNDLDYETLELLEQLLMDYQGTLLLVSHDRAFLDNVVTSTIAFEGNASWREYIGGYADWLKQKPKPATPSGTEADQKTPKSKPKVSESKKLSYKYQRELDELPQKIESLEIELEALSQEMSDPNFYQADQNLISERGNLLKQKQQELEACYSRWEELEEM